MIVDPLPEQLRLLTVPALEGPDGRSALEDGLWQLAVVEVDVAQEGPLQVLAAPEAVALEDVLDPAVEAFDHAVRLRPHWRREAVLGAKEVQLVLAGGHALAPAEQAVGESLSVVGQHPGDLHRGRAFQVAQEALADRHRRCCRAKRNPTDLQMPRPGLVATMERIPPPKPHREEDALRKAAEAAPHSTGFRPPGSRISGPYCRPERLHRARHTRD